MTLARPVVKPFDPKQIELAATFADQAVIAIENARLFNEVQARTDELIGRLLASFTPQECRNFLRHAGYVRT